MRKTSRPRTPRPSPTKPLDAEKLKAVAGGGDDGAGAVHWGDN
jgi:hypothetical protein